MLPTRVLFKRSVWKGPHIVPYDSLVPRPSLAIPNVEAGKSAPPIRTQARAATILPSFIGLKFQVYNGKVYHDVTITEDMVGHKLGEFSPYVP
ncbi:mitochondrial ribosomal protein S19 [Sporothrix brasiliensis 5110]|uniref:Mitochondrial ribosomal protein S19 n=1 Tax=Sporothrix brasiliensis 5110 TaxID=1398154 RepID=A0A0C2ISQ6_9PEZI|nr:mitochondrial ribosomal protein S19 [Sporothrix brasiliensis 5110]KIH89885.1 mitochondrial ribosomal protein S19 [Sporothrix brasiliensis 5110]